MKNVAAIGNYWAVKSMTLILKIIFKDFGKVVDDESGKKKRVDLSCNDVTPKRPNDFFDSLF